MPVTGAGDDRYVARGPVRQAAMVVGGVDLGPALKPQVMLAWLRQIEHLGDREIVEAMQLGSAADLGRIWAELSPAEVEQARSAGQETSTSRVVAWRRRNREMTWLELRVLLAGLREMMDRGHGDC